MGATVPTMPIPPAYGAKHVGAPIFARPRHQAPRPQCCPQCGAPATRNLLHCEYCRTEFDDSTPGINIYALCDFDPETERMVNGKIRSYLDDALIEVTTLEDPAPRYAERMPATAVLGAVVGAFMGCPHLGLAIASRLVR